GSSEAEGRYNGERVYGGLYAGGKHDNNADGAAYEYSLGLNGLGACATQYSSEYMHVTSYNNGKVYHIEFAKGEPATELSIREPDKKEKGRTGTIIRWKPDLEVFTDIAVPRENLETTLRKQSIVNAGTSFVFRWEKEDGTFDETVYLYENGIIDYVGELAGGASLTPPVLWNLETRGRDREGKPEYKLEAHVSFCFSNSFNLLEYYHNSSFLEHGGSPDKAVRSAFTFAIDKYLKTTGKYNKNEAKITFADIEDCLILVINSFSTIASYANQTKKAITNTFIAEALTDFMKQQLEIYFTENPIDADKICGQVLVNKRSRETAENTRLNLKKKLGGSMDMTNRVEKFVSCRSKEPDRRELYIVEGDSACTSTKLGRDAEFQAIMPVRGKTLNCLKCSYDRIFKSDIICDLIRIIGCGVELKTKLKSDMVPFDPEALHWSKIIICTDADEDGYQIRTLILTMFYRLLPSLIKMGRVYIAESPLFEIINKDKSYFAYNEEEKEQILASLSGKSIVQRSKGLGENEPDMMWQTTMNPATRRLIRVEPADEAQTMLIFDTLLGEDLPARKEFIALHGFEYVQDADL
ncbi:MAG: toprim domain-containing protein, partial [Clostridia bacterium]|nr:toprim domain-containing protein [Clostridia bacterium]